MNANSLRTDVLRSCARFGGILGGILVLAAGSTALANDPIKTVKVDCARGETISKALTRGDDRKLLVLIRNTCNESVLIDRSDVTLRGETGFGGGIAGPDPAVNTVTVTASRVVIEGLTITGGRNGISAIGASGLTVRNATIQNTGRNGIAFAFGASGVVDGCTIQLNPADGVTVSAAQVTLVNSVVSQNRSGVNLGDGASARIGVDNLVAAAGNTISLNGSNGVIVNNGSAALIAMNQITGNGTAALAPGVQVLRSSATIVGGNTISGNSAQGVFARNASVVIGDPGFGLPTVNTITGNGNVSAPGGVFVFGTSMVVRNAVISGNNGGVGLGLSLRSHAELFGSTIQNNAGDGIRLLLGSALLILPPSTVVSGNTGWGLQCLDGESSVANQGLLNLSGGNVLGEVSPGCTGF